MMNQPCPMIQDLLPLYVDQICSQESRRAVEEHVENCPLCRARLEELRREDPLPPPEQDREQSKARVLAGVKRQLRRKKLYRQPVDPVSLSRLPIPRKCGDQQRHRSGHQTRDGDPPPLRRRGGSGLVSGRGPGGTGGSGRGLLPGAGRRRGAALGEAGVTQEGRGQGRRERRASPSARVRVSWG